MGDNHNETRQTLEMPTDEARRATRRAVMIAFAVALGVLVVTALIVRSGKVSQLEKDVFHIINGLPNFLRPFMYVFQLAGLLFVPLLVAAQSRTLPILWAGFGVARRCRVRCPRKLLCGFGT